MLKKKHVCTVHEFLFKKDQSLKFMLNFFYNKKNHISSKEKGFTRKDIETTDKYLIFNGNRLVNNM